MLWAIQINVHFKPLYSFYNKYHNYTLIMQIYIFFNFGVFLLGRPQFLGIFHR